jgi:hypothetical protein
MKTNLHKFFEPLLSIPVSARIFTALGIALSVGTFFLVNFQHGLSHFFMIELGRKVTEVPTHDDYVFLLQFVTGGLAYSLIFSFHWYVYAALSRKIQSEVLPVVFGIIILGCDAFIRIQSVFFAKHSTAPIAVVFIPIVVGAPSLIAYSLLDFFLKKSKPHK